MTLDVEYDMVFIIDCLSEKEREEFPLSQNLMNFLAAVGIDQKTSWCASREMFFGTLKYLEKTAKAGSKFCLHIVSHGNKDGLVIMTAGEMITWDEFRGFLQTINFYLSGKLVLNMTSCFGLEGIRIVDEKSKQFPFFGLIAYSRELAG